MLATRPARRAMAARNWVTPAACPATSSAITVPTHVPIAATWRAFVTRPAARGRTLTACTAWPSITASAIPSPESPGKEMLMITVEHSPGGSSPSHRHNAHAMVYVLEGSVVMQVKGGKQVTLTPGQSFYEGP